MNATEVEFRAVAGPRRTSQCDKILDALEKANGTWVSLPDLVRTSGAYAVHSRVSDLRKRGHRIEQANEHVGGLIHSSYRLLQEGMTPIPFSSSSATQLSAAERVCRG
jgi:hypothetical protein